MEVSFHGFKNAGVQRHMLYDIRGKKASLSIFNTELTNDARGHDLDEFKKIFQKSSNKQNPNFLNLQVWQLFRGKNLASPECRFFVNDKEFRVNDKNLELFGKIARLLKKIVNTDEKDFKVNKDYLESEDMAKNFVSVDEAEDSELIESMHEPEKVKVIAEDLLNKITDVVEEVLTL